MTIATIIAKLTAKGERYADQVYVGPGYTKAALLNDLRALQASPDVRAPLPAGCPESQG